MADQELELAIKAGTTFRYAITITTAATDADGIEIVDARGNPTPGQPYDFTDCTARMDARFKGPDTRAVVTLTTDNGGITPLAGGVIEIYMTPAQTDALGYDAGKFVTTAAYDIEVTYPSGDVIRPVAGSLAISPSVSRSG